MQIEEANYATVKAYIFSQVYRHLLFNRLGSDSDNFDVRPSPVLKRS